MSPEFEQYQNHAKYLTERLVHFATTQDNSILADADNPVDTYTRSIGYQVTVTHYHHTSDMARFTLRLLELVALTDSIIDVGCASGFAGLLLAQYGRDRLTFHDFPGVGLNFLEWFIETEPLPRARTVAYGQPVERHDWAICCDALEHTGNHLGALRWLSTLGRKVALCYPLSVPFSPPYVKVIDEWVDDEMIQIAIAKRHNVIDTYIADGRRFTIYEVG